MVVFAAVHVYTTPPAVTAYDFMLLTVETETAVISFGVLSALLANPATR
jgi:hypothetical protein